MLNTKPWLLGSIAGGLVSLPVPWPKISWMLIVGILLGNDVIFFGKSLTFAKCQGLEERELTDFLPPPPIATTEAGWPFNGLGRYGKGFRQGDV